MLTASAAVSRPAGDAAGRPGSQAVPAPSAPVGFTRVHTRVRPGCCLGPSTNYAPNGRVMGSCALTARPPAGLAQDEALHGVGETLVLVRGRHPAGGPLDL